MTGLLGGGAKGMLPPPLPTPMCIGERMDCGPVNAITNFSHKFHCRSCILRAVHVKGLLHCFSTCIEIARTNWY